MDGILEVTPASLHACAVHGDAAGAAVSGLAVRAADACDQVAGPHHAWRFAAALTVLAGQWRQQLARQGSDAAADAAKLKDTADTYASAESTSTDLIRRVRSAA